MQLSRREFLKAAAAVGLTATELYRVEQAVAGSGDPSVIWLQGQGCTGCSVSFLNSVYYATVDELLLNTINLEYDSTVVAAAGSLSMANALAARNYILVIEGAIPTGTQEACTIGNGMTMLAALKTFAQNATAIVAVGTCASYGGISGGKPNPTGAVSVQSALSTLAISKPLINVPGCPVHPDWLVGTLSYFLVNGKAPPLDSSGRPTDYFGKTVHSQCPNLSSFNSLYAGRMEHSNGTSCLACHTNTDTAVRGAKMIGQAGCMFALGCKGPQTYCDCPSRGWNSPAKGQAGVSWCIAANAPCHGCTEPNFPDGMEPFFILSRNDLTGGAGGTNSGLVKCSDCHTGRPDGTLPAGHRTVDSSHYVDGSSGSGGTSGGGSGSNLVRCSDCHSGRPDGTLPAGHQAIGSGHYVSGSSGSGSGSGSGGTGSVTVRCSDCHSGRSNGTLPAGHRTVDSSHYVITPPSGGSGGTSGGGTGSTLVRCSDCHSGRADGTLPAGHQAIGSGHNVSGSSGGTSSGETEEDDDERSSSTTSGGGSSSTSVRCSDCHSGRADGTLPAGHQAIGSGHNVSGSSGGTSGGSTGSGESDDSTESESTQSSTPTRRTRRSTRSDD